MHLYAKFLTAPLDERALLIAGLVQQYRALCRSLGPGRNHTFAHLVLYNACCAMPQCPCGFCSEYCCRKVLLSERCLLEGELKPGTAVPPADPGKRPGESLSQYVRWSPLCAAGRAQLIEYPRCAMYVPSASNPSGDRCCCSVLQF